LGLCARADPAAISLAQWYDDRHVTAVRYPPTHKNATRRRIVEAAGRAFRERGVAETGVDEVMRLAGLTHGGFYAHFRDKSELVSEACEAAFDAAIANLERISSAPTPAARARLLIDSYLARRHRDNAGSGCVVVAVGADMSRVRGAARTSYSRGLMAHLDRLTAALRMHRDADKNRDRVMHLISALVGALLVARAIDDPVRSDQVLHAMRRQLRAEFCRERPGAIGVESGNDFMRTY
jgi:TetR/AcrR family transcriptional regulator, transcriptional repressor for nem operon